jgi:hypothetical protein
MTPEQAKQIQERCKVSAVELGSPEPITGELCLTLGRDDDGQLAGVGVVRGGVMLGMIWYQGKGLPVWYPAPDGPLLLAETMGHIAEIMAHFDDILADLILHIHDLPSAEAMPLLARAPIHETSIDHISDAGKMVRQDGEA